MKKAITVYAWVQVILAVVGAVWAIKSPEQYGDWLAKMMLPMLKCAWPDEYTTE